MVGARWIEVRRIALHVISWMAAMIAIACATLPADGFDAPAGFVLIPPGTFTMGSPPDEPGRFDDEPQHPVTLTRAFLMCDHHVTQGEWEAIMGWNDSRFHGHANRPVENVTWFDCVVFCNRSSEKEGLESAYRITDIETEGHHVSAAAVTWNVNASGYRLPTEAEWEYACRAGSTTAFHNGSIAPHPLTGCSADSILDVIGWYCVNSGRETHDVKTKPPNAWGLFDMAGNVQHWCWDRYSELDAAPATDPAGPDFGAARLWRGGGWDYNPRHCRSADRGRDEAWGHYEDVGMRLCRWAR
jgi:formylglycine-generating enzyme required for sulfatase activity